MTDSYADTPVSVSEVRGLRSGECDKWTPRDVLVNLLRKIDAGEAAPEQLVLVYREPADDGEGYTNQVRVAAKDRIYTLGLLTNAITMVQEDR